jgi:hypothetical protein
MRAKIMADDVKLPVGAYHLGDGRQFVGLDDFQLRAMARDGWRRQQIADAALFRKLDAARSARAARPAPPLEFTPVGITGDLFMPSPIPAASLPEGGGSSRATSEGGRSPNPPPLAPEGVSGY